MNIIEYQSKYKRDIIDLILQIQVNEFGVDITEDDQPDLKTIPEVYQQGNGNFWIAVMDNQVAGTISLLDIGNDELALKKMFVHPNYRGKDHGVSSGLLSNALDYAKSHKIKHVYLGTTAKYLAAHRFYEKNGFIEVSEENLPESFPIMAVDTRFYKYTF